jgi:hypothetical protein
MTYLRGDSPFGTDTGYRLDVRGSIPDSGQEIIAHYHSCPINTGGLFLVAQWPERETSHSPPSSAEVKNSGAVSTRIPPLFHTSSWRGA